MNLLSTLTTAADEEQLRLRPLPEHAAASQAEHLRSHYALLLAAVLTAQPAVSEPQTRLLRLLLDALKLGDIRGQLFDQARDLEPAPLLEAARLIREAGFAHHLVVDALVLLRLDAPLGDDSARLAGELATFLGLDEAALIMRATDASDILGLGATEAEQGNDGAEGPNVDTEGKKQILDAPPVSLSELWPGKLRQPLTAQALRDGLQGGLWFLDSSLDVDFPWKADDAVMFFRNGATLNTYGKEGAIKLTGCYLIDAALAFQGECRITLKRCDLRGDYDPAAKCTALTSLGKDLTITDCQFSTRNARSISVQNTLNLTGSSFTLCGNTELDGGALLHSDHKRIIENCRFDRCLAARGGAIWVSTLADVNKCEFVACESRSFQDKKAGDVAIYATQVKYSKAIAGCVFRQTSLVIGKAADHDNGSVTFVMSSQFHNANVYYHSKYLLNKISSSDCSFLDGSEIDKLIY